MRLFLIEISNKEGGLCAHIFSYAFIFKHTLIIQILLYLSTCPTCDGVGVNIESKTHKQCIFCDYILIIYPKTYKREHNYFKITLKMNYLTRLIREMNIKYEGDNTPFLTTQETDKIWTMFH